MDNPANPRPSFSVEEIPNPVDPVAAPPPPPVTISGISAEPVWNSPAPAPEMPSPEYTPAPAPVPVAPVAPMETPSVPLNTTAPVLTVPVMPPQQTPPAPPPPVHNAKRGFPIRMFLFLVPALLLVATIFLVARFTGNKYVMREPVASTTPIPTLAPTPEPSPTPVSVPTKTYKNTDMLIQFEIPESYEVLSETDEFVSIGKADVEMFTVSKDTSEYKTLENQRLLENFLFTSYAESEEDRNNFENIIKSVVFLVDTSDWKTFNNTTFNYNIKYPPELELTAPADKKGLFEAKTTIGDLVILSEASVNDAAFTASQIVSSTRTLSGWNGSPKVELKKIGGGDAQVIQGELSGRWKAYVVIWYKNTVVQMTWDDEVARPNQQIFDSMLASFEFTN